VNESGSRSCKMGNFDIGGVKYPSSVIIELVNEMTCLNKSPEIYFSFNMWIINVNN
jgi:hypothetical protein